MPTKRPRKRKAANTANNGYQLPNLKYFSDNGITSSGPTSSGESASAILAATQPAARETVAAPPPPKDISASPTPTNMPKTPWGPTTQPISKTRAALLKDHAFKQKQEAISQSARDNEYNSALENADKQRAAEAAAVATTKAQYDADPRNAASAQALAQGQTALQKTKDYGKENDARSLLQDGEESRISQQEFEAKNNQFYDRRDMLQQSRDGKPIDASTISQEERMAAPDSVRMDYSNFVQNAQVPESILRANAIYGEHLSGAPIMPDMPVDPLVAAARGGDMEAEAQLRATEAAQKATMDRIQADPQYAQRDRNRADAAQEARREIGAQRRADSLEARSRNTTPDAIREEREDKQQSSQQAQKAADIAAQEKRAEIQASHVARKRDAAGKKIELYDTQIADINDSYRTLSKTIENLAGETKTDAIAQRNKMFESLTKAQDEQKKLVAEMPYLHIPSRTRGSLVSELKKIGSVTAEDIAYRQKIIDDFDARFGAGSAEHILSK